MRAVRILRIATGGDGVGRLEDGRTVFVSRTAPGDLVEPTRLREHRRYARARAGRLLEPSLDRVEPRCPHYVQDDCGGCQLQHLSPTAQREARRTIAGDALRRIAKLELGDPELIPAAEEWEYRTKLTLHLDPGGRIGLHPFDQPDRVFDLVHCYITRPELMSLWRELRSRRELLPQGLRQIVLRLDRRGERHVVLVTGSDSPWIGGAELLAALESRGEGFTLWLQPEGGQARATAGTDQPFPATVFEQVHPAMGDRVRAHAVARLGEVAGRHVWDLYAGIGETTAALAGAGASVESVESDGRAVAEAEARGPGAKRYVGRAERVVASLQAPDLVITNPPRAGMDERVTAALGTAAPRRIVYISCDPATLARDLTRLPDYRLQSVTAFDLFPQTAHVETVAVLDRAS
jgi:23S rRNA (uracil1939-C5)-methyltransferase